MKTYIGNTRYKILNANRQRMKIVDNSKPYDAEIEYLESNGTQWIDTNFIPDVNSAAHIVWSSIERNAYGYFGSRSLDTNGVYRFCGTTFSSSQSFTFAMTYNEWADNKVPLTNNIIYDCYAENGKYIINGTEYSSDVISNYQGSTFYLFRYYRGNNAWHLSKMRCYCLKLYTNSTLVRDMIPVRVGNVGYMYDKISGELFGNSGTGNFILGEDLPYDAEIEYLESNMTDIQYIDLGLKGTPNVVVELKFSTTALSDAGQAIFGSRYSWGTNAQGSAFMLYIGRGGTTYTFQYGHNGDVNQVSSVQYNSQTWHTATLGKNTRIDSWTYTYPYYNFTTPQNLTLFGSNFSGGAVNRGSNTRIAYCKVYVGGTLTLELIPVRKGQVGYMYDKVSGQLFGNSGSGNFILGNDK